MTEKYLYIVCKIP